MGILYAVIIFSIVVIIHELGHFLLAKANGITVFEFSLGMGPKLLSKQWGDTLYCIKLLPLGGSCMMGEDVVDEENEEQEVEGQEEIQAEIQKGNFNEKSVWARISVIAGGPVFNFILAFICSVILIGFVGYDPAVIGNVSEGSAAMEAGLEVGDEILKINNKTINLWREVSTYSMFYGDQDMDIVFKRDGKKYHTNLVPQYDEESNRHYMGLSQGPYEKGTILECAEYGLYLTKYYMFSVVDSLKMLFNGSVGVEEISGPVGIVEQVGNTYTESVKIGWEYVFLNMLHLIILLSANLGVMNLLPIPALDGGRLVFLGIEAVRGKPLSQNKEGIIHVIGFALLMLFMAFIMFNDVMRIFTK